MKKITTAIGLLILFSGCAPDDQVFDISKLTERHQLLFHIAIDKLNTEKKNAVFEVSDDGHSTATYGTPNPNADATTYHPIPFIKSWRIIFRPNVQSWSDKNLLKITIHELCHVLLDHYLEDFHKNNPQGGTCLY